MVDSLILNNKVITFKEVLSKRVKGDSDFEKQTLLFLLQWLTNESTFTFQTSGSTGLPKNITVNRTQIQASIRQTASFLNLKENQTAFVCLDTSKIAGIMMLARGLEIGMKMTINTPTSTPLKDIQGDFEFCALVPLQVDNSSNQSLNRIKKLIIGGGVIQEALETRLKKLSNATFHTYGMTETLSHVALREISPNHTAEFKFLPEVDFKTNEDQTLSIKSNVTEGVWIQTNDIVKLNQTGFTWLGRTDNTINSGGYKINLDILKTKILSLNPDFEFVLTSTPDSQFGERLILLSLSEDEINLESLAFYEKPRLFLKTSSFPILVNGKIDSQKIKRSIESYKEWNLKD